MKVKDEVLDEQWADTSSYQRYTKEVDRGGSEPYLMKREMGTVANVSLSMAFVHVKGTLIPHTTAMICFE
ncbi:hypothetical protein HZH68_012590 [Vespula germanica]|uniref:Uncharacterized protein n=1 Tax=Vespula germanica TaxID=30212 RepID=A0A834JH85_VESGE|nr:hypothetical protein HZH68_012590 [Vespula germanica]